LTRGRRIRHRVVGAKLAAFARRMFELLGAQAGDALDDLLPGDASCLQGVDDTSLVDDGSRVGDRRRRRVAP
jgi:hypothetical protein